MSQHKLLCRSSLPLLLFNFFSRHKISMSRQNLCSFPVVSVATGAFMSRQVPPSFDIQHKKPCRNIISLCLSSFVTFFSCSIATRCHYSQHRSSSILNPLCCDRKNTIVTFFLSHSLERLSRHKKLYRDIDCCNCSFFLLSYWIFLLFELKSTKHEVGE